MSRSVSEATKPLTLGDSSADFEDGSSSDEFPKSLLELYFTKSKIFYLFVITPSALAALYYLFLVSPQYVVETRMLVRTIGVSERFDLSESRSGKSIIGGDSLTQDSYVVANYLESMDLVSILEREIGLRDLFSRSDIDYFSRLSAQSPFERLHRYWEGQIDTYVDGPSGIIVFTVRAFTPEDSLLIMEHAIKAADDMIAKLSDRAKKQLVERAKDDVKVSLKRYNDSLTELQSYQNKVGILNPIAQAKLTGEVIGSLTEDKLSLMIQLEILKAAKADNSAMARQLERSVAALDKEIQIRQNSVAGQTFDGIQLSEKLREFARLETRKLVAEAIYEASVRNLDTANATAIRRTTFISIFSRPTLPEESRYPKRFSSWLIVALGFLTLWITGTLIWMSIQDHRV